MKRREFIAGSIALAGCAGSPSPPNIAEPLPPIPPPAPVLMANNKLLAFDNFASGSLAAGWSTSQNAPAKSQVILGSPNVTEPNALSTNAGQAWSALGVLGNQVSECISQLLTSEPGTNLNLRVRAQPAANSGYEVDITNASAGIYRFDAGVATQLGSTISGLTFAAGDVWAFVAEGAVISLYQNDKRILFVTDTTYTTGYPGYIQYSSVNITHTQVSAWRGYNSVQQNGIWQKQGVIIPALAADLASSGFGTFNNSQVLYEGGAVLLSGTVYKMWFSIGGATTGAIIYAESLDGINWTRRSPAVITGFINPSVIKVASTYWLYCQPQPGGSGSFAAYTSTDGVTWTQQTSTIIGLGTAGQWDAQAIYLFQPVDIVASTWRALYVGQAAGPPVSSSVGLATSSDGINWTKSGSNPVLTSASGARGNSSAVVNIGGTYYMWAQGSQKGLFSGSFDDPTDTVRFSSTNLINWTQGSPPAPWHAQMTEFVNGNLGQCIPNAIINVNNQAYLYTTSSTLDSSTATYQISLAVASAPIAAVVQKNEDAMPKTATSTFASLAGWGSITGISNPTLAGGIVTPAAAAANYGLVYTGSSFSADQFSEATIHTLGGDLTTGNVLALIVRASLVAQTFYECDIVQKTGTQGAFATGNAVYRRISGAATQIGAGAGFSLTPNVGDVFRFAVLGNNPPTLFLFQNGYLVWTFQDFSASAIQIGAPGFMLFAQTTPANTSISGWAGGNVNVSPFASAGGGDLGPGYDFFYRF